MAGASLGKKLLRNVIRHTDIHNKIQEESEMWKLRGREKHVPPSDHSSRKPPSTARGYMHCDRDEDDSSPSRDRGGVRDRLSERHERGRPLSDRDEREARYWTRKLYEFEANDPDRWGHSGFKELYPEEFKSDGGESSGGDDNVRHKKKKCKSSREADHRKHSSKSSKKKKRKKEKKKQRRAETSDSDSGDSDGEARRKRRRREEEKRKVRRKERREDESSSEESESEGEGERERERRGGGGGGGRRKRHRHRRNSDSHQERPSKKRKNWKAADGEKTDESSDD
ncbi:NKAP domain containing 1 isoform X2 [Sardina pilchardus]|uniref:NKAP domain containing 1 isoform X2 n=1 Tax=Sardina pilchardus TaxID=27697 RepID=UPI002E16521D